MSGIFICAAKRTPFGAFGGALKSMSAKELGVISTKAALAAGNIDPELVDDVYFGNVIQTGNDAAYLARHIGLGAGVPIDKPALTINRLCGSGFESVVQAAKAIQLKEASIVVAGGTENMSAAPLVTDGVSARWGVPLGKGLQMRDALWDGLTDAYSGTPMGITAENLATEYDITRQQCDEYAIRSQTLWGASQKEGIFDLELAPIDIETKKGTIQFETDEHPRPESSLDKISKLGAVFKKDGVVTAANASGICDGAGTIILASEEAVAKHNLKPLCRLVSYAVVGCEPTIMGIGPVEAIRKALAAAGDLSLENDVDRVEINEAFAAQALACAKALDLDMDKFNVHGGAISIGHPLGTSGSRITAHLANEFAYRPDHKIHVGSACIGGGQGIAVVLERA